MQGGHNTIAIWNPWIPRNCEEQKCKTPAILAAPTQQPKFRGKKSAQLDGGPSNTHHAAQRCGFAPSHARHQSADAAGWSRHVSIKCRTM